MSLSDTARQSGSIGAGPGEEIVQLLMALSCGFLTTFGTSFLQIETHDTVTDDPRGKSHPDQGPSTIDSATRFARGPGRLSARFIEIGEMRFQSMQAGRRTGNIRQTAYGHHHHGERKRIELSLCNQVPDVRA